MAEQGVIPTATLWQRVMKAVTQMEGLTIQGATVERTANGIRIIIPAQKAAAAVLPSIRGGAVRVRVGSNASGGGKYYGYVVSLPSSAIAATGDLADSALGADGGDQVLILNAAEAGKSTHDLTAGTPVQKTFIAVYVGQSSESPAKAVYMVNGFDWAACT